MPQRVVAPPVLAVGAYIDRPPARPDDWSRNAAIAALSSGSNPTASRPIPNDDDSGLRHSPSLKAPDVPPRSVASSDLGLLDDDASSDEETLLRERARPDARLQRSARLAALDPADGIAL